MTTNIAISLIRGNHPMPVTSGIFENVIGQNEARATLDFFLKSHNPSTPFPTLMLTGGHGLGKTYFANKVASALGRRLFIYNCVNLNDSDDFITRILREVFQAQKPATILLDETQAIKSDVATTLLTLLNPVSSHIDITTINGVRITWDMTLINMIFATTDAYKIDKPLRNRCHEIYFYPYTEEDLFSILKGYLPDISFECSKRDLALTCRGRARDAYQLSLNIRRYLNMNGGVVFDQNDLNRLKGMLSVQPMGLTRAEVEVLKAIQEHQPISVSNLAIKLMTTTNVVEEDLEIRLRELGFIESSSRGRNITRLGQKYLEEYKL